MNRFILTLLASFVLSFSLAQEINRQEAPTFALNAMVLEQASPLVLEGNHLSADTDYRLSLSDPDGNVVFEEVLRSSPEGSIAFSQQLDLEGFWQIAIRGEDARAIFEVEVVPGQSEPSSAERSSPDAATTDTATTDAATTDTAIPEVPAADASPESSEQLEPVETQAAEVVAPAVESAPSEVAETEVAETEVAETEVAETAATTPVAAEETPAIQTDAVESPELQNLEESVAEIVPEVEPNPEEAIETVTETAVDVEEEPMPSEVSEASSPEVSVEADSSAETEMTEGISEPGVETEANLENVSEADSAPDAEESLEASESLAQEQDALAETADADVVAETSTAETAVTAEVESEESAEPEAQAETPAPLVALDPSSVTALLEGNTVLGQVNGETVWTLEFSEMSGETLGLLAAENSTFVGHGNSVLELDNATGRVLNRWLVAGQVTDLSGSAENLSINTQVATATQSFSLLEGEIQEPVRFAPVPELYSWLKNEANVDNPVARLEQDPSNPWLALKVAQETDDLTKFSEAVEKGQSFYDLAGIARGLVDAGQIDLANQAMSKALTDFAKRGYDPRLLRDLGLHEAYHFPLRPLESAIALGERAKADFWANWLKYFVTPDTPQIAETMREYASLVSRQDGRDAAREWRAISSSGNRTSVATVLESFFAMLGRVGWYGVMALLVAILSLHLTLLFKYWSPQSLFLRRRKAVGRSTGALPRLFVMRYYSSFEKLVLVLLFAAVVLLAGLATWNNASVNSLSLDSGSLNAASVSALETADLKGERGSFIRAYAAQVAGDLAQAEAEYRAAPSVPAALNNLASLNSDSALYTAALELAPNMLEAKFNIGQDVNAFLFQKDYLPGQAVLAVPSQEDIQAATAGSWQAAVVRTFSNPWTSLSQANLLPDWGGARLPWLSQYIWYVIMALFFLWAAVTLIWLFIPRPRLARNAPRNPLYQVLAILVPGSGAADEMWGLLLLIPWAIIGLDTLADIFNWGFGIGLSRRWDYILLAIIYLINLVAVVVEFFSYSNRMRALKRDNEELAREFRLIK